MIAAIPAFRPFGAALWTKAHRLMDVILHIGAHRCATTSFQHYLRSNLDELAERRVGFWGPLRTRSGLFSGLQPNPGAWPGQDGAQRARGRVQLRCAQSERNGLQQLIVSDENMLGTMRANLRLGSLYSGAGERMARFAEAFGGYATCLVLNIRSLDYYWASVMGYRAARGEGLPAPRLMPRLAQSTRTWRDVITDIACARLECQVLVLPFERFAGRPEAQFEIATGQAAPRGATRERHNATPDLAKLRRLVDPSGPALPEGVGRWMPFSPDERAALREAYADDLMWLAAGADGLARLVSDPEMEKAEKHPPSNETTRGRHHERRHIAVARIGRGRAARQAS